MEGRDSDLSDIICYNGSGKDINGNLLDGDGSRKMERQDFRFKLLQTGM